MRKVTVQEGGEIPDKPITQIEIELKDGDAIIVDLDFDERHMTICRIGPEENDETGNTSNPIIDQLEIVICLEHSDTCQKPNRYYEILHPSERTATNGTNYLDMPVICISDPRTIQA